MTNVVVCSAAEVDYTESLCWYAKHSVKVASEFEQDFESSLLQIIDASERYPKCDEHHRFFLMRRFPFQVIYREVPDGIIIVAVAHTSRLRGCWADR